MEGQFDYFVVFAGMRTGSNFLEANLNRFSDLTCHGEAFNPSFIGYPKRDEILGVTRAMRDADPARLIAAIRSRTDGLGGFRFFHDHDPRALEICLEDPRCAKIVLTRNPLESYVSRKIAQSTGQWKLTDVRRHRRARIRFEAAEFHDHLATLKAFQSQLLKRFQASAQTAFYLDYEDLQDVDTLNGLGRFLGSVDRLNAPDRSVLRQNPEALKEKVENFDEMEKALSGLDPFDVARTPDFEPRRRAGIPGYVAAARAPLLFMPLRSAPEAEIRAWLAALDDASVSELRVHFDQKSLRRWKRMHVPHRSFTVIRHPVARAHHIFCARILAPDDDGLTKIRRMLHRTYKLPVFADEPVSVRDPDGHRAGFIAFLEFLRTNLSGQSPFPVHPDWASQAGLVQGMARFALPDVILREDEMEVVLPDLARKLGYGAAPAHAPSPPAVPVALESIYDDEIERLVRSVYRRDYMMFGFGPWRDGRSE